MVYKRASFLQTRDFMGYVCSSADGQAAPPDCGSETPCAENLDQSSNNPKLRTTQCAVAR